VYVDGYKFVRTYSFDGTDWTEFGSSGYFPEMTIGTGYAICGLSEFEASFLEVINAGLSSTIKRLNYGSQTLGCIAAYATE